MNIISSMITNVQIIFSNYRQLTTISKHQLNWNSGSPKKKLISVHESINIVDKLLKIK